MTEKEIAHKYVHGLHDALTDSQEKIDMVQDILKFAEEYHQSKLKNMESSSRIMSVTKERTYSDNDMLKSFKAGFKYCISRVNPSFKEWLSEYAT